MVNNRFIISEDIRMFNPSMVRLKVTKYYSEMAVNQ